MQWVPHGCSVVMLYVKLQQQQKKDFEQFYLEGKYMVLSSKHKANTWRNVVFFFCFSLLKVSVHCTILALVEFTLQDQANSNPHPEADC